MSDRVRKGLRCVGVAATVLMLAGAVPPLLASAGNSGNCASTTNYTPAAANGVSGAAENGQTRRQKLQTRAIMARVKAQLIFLEHRTAETYAGAADASIASLEELVGSGADDAAIMDALIASMDAFDAVYDAAMDTAERIEAKAEARMKSRNATDKQVRHLTKMIDRFARNLDEIEIGEIERIDAALQDLLAGGDDDDSSADSSGGDDDGNTGGGPDEGD